MLSREDTVRLQHMLDAARQILCFMEGRSREDLDTDKMLSLSVTRLVEIIGEAAKNVSSDTQLASPEIPWKQIKGTRDRLAHAYFDVNLDIIWQIVDSSLEPMTQNIERLLSGTESQ